MPNWCQNRIYFTGSKENLQKAKELFTDFKIKEATTNEGQKAEFNTNEDYFFNVYLENEDFDFVEVSFESRWSPIIENVIEIAKHFNLNFEYTFEESGNNIFGKAIYTEGNEEAEKLELDDNDFDLFQYNEDEGIYTYNGEIYESDFEILENIWEKKFDTTY